MSPRLATFLVFVVNGTAVGTWIALDPRHQDLVGGLGHRARHRAPGHERRLVGGPAGRGAVAHAHVEQASAGALAARLSMAGDPARAGADHAGAGRGADRLRVPQHHRGRDHERTRRGARDRRWQVDHVGPACGLVARWRHRGRRCGARSALRPGAHHRGRPRRDGALARGRRFQPLPGPGLGQDRGQQRLPHAHAGSAAAGHPHRAHRLRRGRSQRLGRRLPASRASAPRRRSLPTPTRPSRPASSWGASAATGPRTASARCGSSSWACTWQRPPIAAFLIVGNAFVALLGMAVAGVGIANTVPQIFGAAGRIPPHGPSLSAVFTSLTVTFMARPHHHRHRHRCHRHRCCAVAVRGRLAGGRPDGARVSRLRRPIPASRRRAEGWATTIASGLPTIASWATSTRAIAAACRSCSPMAVRAADWGPSTWSAAPPSGLPASSRRTVRAWVAPTRPPAAPWRAGPTTWPSLANALGLGRFRLLSESGGGPFALATAWALPNRVERVALLSSPGSFDIPGAMDGMSPGQPLIWLLARWRAATAGWALERQRRSAEKDPQRFHRTHGRHDQRARPRGRRGDGARAPGSLHRAPLIEALRQGARVPSRTCACCGHRGVSACRTSACRCTSGTASRTRLRPWPWVAGCRP